MEIVKQTHTFQGLFIEWKNTHGCINLLITKLLLIFSSSLQRRVIRRWKGNFDSFQANKNQKFAYTTNNSFSTKNLNGHTLEKL